MLKTVLTSLIALKLCNPLDFRSKLTFSGAGGGDFNGYQSSADNLSANNNPSAYNPYAQLSRNGIPQNIQPPYIPAAAVAVSASVTTIRPSLNAYDAKQLARLATSMLNARHRGWKNASMSDADFSSMFLLTTTVAPTTSVAPTFPTASATIPDTVRMNTVRMTTGSKSTTSTPSSTTTATTPKPVYITRENLNVLQQSSKANKNTTTTTVLSSYSKIPGFMSRKSNSNIFLPSNRLINDVLVIPSSRRFYVLVIMPIHESADYQGFECGQVDLNGFVRLAALIDAIERINAAKTLKDAGLSIGAVVVDSCSSDLRTLADLYELLFGTNIERSELIAVIRDDFSYLPNVDEFTRYLHLPTINTFFSTEERPMTTGMLPTEESLIEAVVSFVRYTHSSCVSVLFDDSHPNAARLTGMHAENREICIDGQIHIRGQSSVETAQMAVRKLLLTQARFVVVFVSDNTWLHILQAFRNEMVIAGRFVLFAPQSERWSTSLQFIESWPHFDQLLLSVTNRRLYNQNYINHLTQRFSKLPFPQHWLRQFWMTAFKCHIDGENVPGKKFSRPCNHIQTLNLTSVVPDLNLEPITLAVNSVAVSLRHLVNSVCPGALLQTLSDCVNDPSSSLYKSIKSTSFNHYISTEPDATINQTTGFRDAEIIINRVLMSSQEVRFEEVANWNSNDGLRYVANSDLFLEERDGSRQRVYSSCPKSTCAMRLIHQRQAGRIPTFRSGFNDLNTLVFAGFAIVWIFVCLMCIYQQLVSQLEETYRVCTMITFIGVALLAFLSIFFIMIPSSITCTVRTTCLAIALSIVFSPILVKSALIWRREIILSNLNSVHSGNTNGSTMFWLTFTVILFQIVVITEWILFEPPTGLVYVSYGGQSMWRCAPGQKYEQRLFYSLILDIFMIAISLVTSLITAKNMDSRQNILISVTAILFGLLLYLILPLVRFTVRDKVFSSALLTFSMLVVIISYCRSAFTKSDIILMKSTTFDKGPDHFTEVENHTIRVHEPAYWLSQSVALRHHHSMSTLPISEGRRRISVTKNTMPRKAQMPFRASSLSLVE